MCQQLPDVEADLDRFVDRVRIRICEIKVVDGVCFVGEEGEGILGRLFLPEAFGKGSSLEFFALRR
jgi:hypothetical protein